MPLVYGYKYHVQHCQQLLQCRSTTTVAAPDIVCAIGVQIYMVPVVATTYTESEPGPPGTSYQARMISRGCM